MRTGAELVAPKVQGGEVLDDVGARERREDHQVRVPVAVAGQRRRSGTARFDSPTTQCSSRSARWLCAGPCPSACAKVPTAVLSFPTAARQRGEPT